MLANYPVSLRRAANFQRRRSIHIVLTQGRERLRVLPESISRRTRNESPELFEDNRGSNCRRAAIRPEAVERIGHETEYPAHRTCHDGEPQLRPSARMASGRRWQASGTQVPRSERGAPIHLRTRAGFYGMLIP